MASSLIPVVQKLMGAVGDIFKGVGAGIFGDALAGMFSLATGGAGLGGLLGSGPADGEGGGSTSYTPGGVPTKVDDDTAFKSEVTRLAKKYDIPEKNLYAVMSFETGGTFSPSQKNQAGSGATGLIQFMPSTAAGLGTSTSALAAMSRAEQMKYVEKYFDQQRLPKGASFEDLYMSILYPKAIGKPNSYKLFGKGGDMPGAYAQNAGLDTDGDGAVSKYEAAAKARQHLQQGGVANMKGGSAYGASMVTKSQDDFAKKIAAASTPIIIPMPMGGGGGGGQTVPQGGDTTPFPTMPSGDTSVVGAEYKLNFLRRMTMGASV